MAEMPAPGDGHDEEEATGDSPADSDNSTHPWRELHEWGSINTKEQRSEHELKMALERLKEARDDIEDRDLDVILEMVDEFLDEQLSDQRFVTARIAMHIDRYRRMALAKPGALSLAVEGDSDEAVEAVKTIKSWLIDERDLADSTIGDHLQTIKHLGEYLFEEMPERFDELNPRAWMDDDPTPAVTNIVTWEEAVRMAETRDRPRDQAMILVQWAAGTRPECELWELRFKHLEDMGHYYKLSVPTPAKTGKRPVFLFPASAALRKWHTVEHPAHHECEDGPSPETPLWTYHSSNEPLGYSQIKRIFREAGRDAGLEKTHTAQHFRRSRASVLASRKTINHLDLHQMFGWTRNSNAPKHYIAEFSGETKKHVGEADGHMGEFEDPDPIAPIPCPSCQQWTERGLSACIYCKHHIGDYSPVEEQVAVDPVHAEKDLMTMILDGEVTAEDLESVRKLEDIIKKRSQLFDQIDQLIDLARRDEQGQFTPGKVVPMFVMLVVLFILLV